MNNRKIIIPFIFIAFFLLQTAFLPASQNEMRMAKMDFLISVKDYKKAEKIIEKIDVNKLPSGTRSFFYNRAGFINYKLNRINKALEYYNTAITLNSNLAFVYNNIGVIQFAAGQYEEAEKYYLKAYHKNNNYPRVLVNLAVTSFYLKKYLSAYEWFQSALDCSKEYVKKRFDREKAIKKLDEWVKNNPDDEELKKMLDWARKNKKIDITELDF